MKITVSSEFDGQVFGIDIPNELTLQDFKAYVEAETGIPVSDQVLIHNSKTLQNDEQTLSALGIEEDDLVILNKREAQAQAVPSSSTVEPSDRIEWVRQQALANPQINAQLRSSNPHLHSLLHDPTSFREAMLAAMPPSNSYEVQQEEMRQLQQNPDDLENQAKILELIRQQQIEENLQLAYDISPESFVAVNMLYIKIKIKGHEAYALVDSGAQSTIISPKLAEKFGISNLIDGRFAGDARGIGTVRTQGRIHSVPVSIGDTNLELPCSFSVIDVHVGILFGLDMLRRHKCAIDLGKDALIIGDTETKFLSELEIEKNVKLDNPDEGGVQLTPPTNAGLQTQEIDRTLAARAAEQRQAPVPAPTTGFPEASIAQLTSLGFSIEEATGALRQTNGNVELAASLLFL